MEEYDAYRSAELASLYDAVYADSGDCDFWLATAPAAGEGPILELGCGTGRVLLPLARACHEVVGLDLAEHMLARCREKIAGEPADVRDRVTLLSADMTSFDLDRRFIQVFCAFGTFHHLRTSTDQIACLERCRRHLGPGGRLVLDLVNPDPAPGGEDGHDAAGSTSSTGPAQWTGGRSVSAEASIVGGDRLAQCNDCMVTYDIAQPDGRTRKVTETFPMRMVFRWELEHLLARCGFAVTALWGDYDRSPFAEDSPGMIVVAEPVASAPTTVDPDPCG